MSTPSLTIQLITVSIITLQRQSAHNNNANRSQWNSSYDYVVIGSGSAGAVVASRLTENPQINVLLLEAGGPQNVITDMPGATPALVGTDVDWQYKTVPQTEIGQAFIDHRINTPKGKVIGGTSTINWMLYNRGNRRSYDNWVNTYGANGWSYDEVLPYFKRSENNTDPEIVRQNAGYHGTNGPMKVSSMPKPDQILFLFQDVMNKLGIPTIDVNGESQSGTMIYQLTVNDGTRSGTGNAYIDPNPHPNNLHIVTQALVTRILFSTFNNNITATGVQFEKDGQTFTVNATKEVILSAGQYTCSLPNPIISTKFVANSFQLCHK
jgi:choline dehydrogenase-like flavoprotein